MTEWTMDMWKYFDVMHRHHTVCNPMSLAKLDEFLALCGLADGASVVDIACGKGELLVRLAERSRISGIGVDISPFVVADAERLRDARVPDADLTFVCKAGVDWVPDAPESLDLALCVGAEWVFGGLAGTCRALRGIVRPGGLLAVGMPFWVRDPPPEYLAAEGFAREDFAASLPDAVALAAAEGLELLYMIVSSPDDWDRYEGLQWFAVEEYARMHPDDPDLPEIRRRSAHARDVYLRWGRDHLNWALCLFRR